MVNLGDNRRVFVKILLETSKLIETKNLIMAEPALQIVRLAVYLPNN